MFQLQHARRSVRRRRARGMSRIDRDAACVPRTCTHTPPATHNWLVGVHHFRYEHHLLFVGYPQASHDISIGYDKCHGMNMVDDASCPPYATSDTEAVSRL